MVEVSIILVYFAVLSLIIRRIMKNKSSTFRLICMNAKNKGFTLVELLVVMVIIAIVSTIVISSSFGMSRGSGYSASENMVFNSLQTARQHACTDGKRVVIAFLGDVDKYNDDALVIVEAAGTVTEKIGKGGSGFKDRNSTVPSANNVRKTIWNLTKLSYADGYSVTKQSVDEAATFTEVKGSPKKSDVIGEIYDERYKFPFAQYETHGNHNNTTWEVGDAYGFQIAPMQKMPKGFKIGWDGVSTSPRNKLIVFEPDGTIGTTSVGSSTVDKSASVTLYLYEEIIKGNDKAPAMISIANGKIRKGKAK